MVGWLSGKMGLTSFSHDYIPMAHASAVVFIALSIIFFIYNNYEKSERPVSLILPAVIIISSYCALILLDFLYNFTWDVENIFIKNPEKFGDVLIGRMSPISSFLFVLICIGFLGIRQKKSVTVKYICGSLSSLALIISSVLLIGYLYNAPFLYGSQIIPVSLPSAICFLLLSITLLRFTELKFWSFNLIGENKITRQLLKSFLPIVIFIVILQGFLDTAISFRDINPSLTAALILLIVVLVTIFVVFKISGSIGAQVLSAEQALKESEKQLQKLNVDKDRFISILSHDLRSPFTVILGYSELLIENIHKYDKDQIEVFVKDIYQSTKETFTLLEDILRWVRVQSGKITFEPHNLSFTSISENLLKIFNPLAGAKNITIINNASEEISVFADSDMLKVILRNLISNAIKFTDRNGTINISAVQNSGKVTISVADNGIGIKSDSLMKLFDISQSHTTVDLAGAKGSGLGLVLCKEFVEKHGGNIWVESEEGKGSDFKFTLPSVTRQ